MLRPRVVVTLAGVIALQVATGAQPPSGTQPTFRAGTTLVEVSAVVTRDGRPVTDLRGDDFTVLDNGKPQPLVAFEYVDLGAIDGPAQRRDFVIVLDTLHVDATNTSPMIDTALALIDRLGPYDRVAVSVIGQPDARLDFTTEREPARAMVRRARGQQIKGPVVAGERELQARIAMEHLATLGASLGSGAERRAILLISAGHPTLGQNADTRRADTNNGYVEFLEVIRQAALANVAIYTVDPRGLRAPGHASVASRNMPLQFDTASPQAPQMASASLSTDVMGSLAVLALNTGGIQTRWTNDLTANLSRMIEDSRQYYRLAYAQPDPPPGKSQPLTRSIKVKVSREAVDVRARQRYAPVNATS